MPLTEWADLDLCTSDDVTAELRDLTVVLRDRSAGELDIDPYISKAKELLRQRLQLDIADYFRTTSGLDWYGYISSSATRTSEALDTVLDKIDNPEELLLVAVAQTIIQILRGGALQVRMDPLNYSQVIEPQLALWMQELERRYRTATRLLRFDLNEDDTITEDERIQTRVEISRA